MGASEYLQRYPLFNLLRASQTAAWVHAGQEMTASTGETICQEGGRGVWVYVVLEGKVRIVRHSSEGKEITLGLLGEGEVFGEHALLPPHWNTASCRAASPVRLLTLPLLPLRPVLAALGVMGNLKNWLKRLHPARDHLHQHHQHHSRDRRRQP